MWPTPKGRPGWVLSSAWHWLFSSQHSTNARSGGLRYSPMTSQNLASNCGSLDNLKVRVRCGLMSLACQSACTVPTETWAVRAIERTLCRVWPLGGRVAWVRMMARLSSERKGLRPRPRARSEEHTSELQSRQYLVCRLLLEKKKT